MEKHICFSISYINVWSSLGLSEQQPIPREQFLAQAYQRGGIRETVRASLALKELTEKYPPDQYEMTIQEKPEGLEVAVYEKPKPMTMGQAFAVASYQAPEGARIVDIKETPEGYQFTYEMPAETLVKQAYERGGIVEATRVAKEIYGVETPPSEQRLQKEYQDYLERFASQRKLSGLEEPWSYEQWKREEELGTKMALAAFATAGLVVPFTVAPFVGVPTATVLISGLTSVGISEGASLVFKKEPLTVEETYVSMLGGEIVAVALTPILAKTPIPKLEQKIWEKTGGKVWEWARPKFERMVRPERFYYEKYVMGAIPEEEPFKVLTKTHDGWHYKAIGIEPEMVDTTPWKPSVYKKPSGFKPTTRSWLPTGGVEEIPVTSGKAGLVTVTKQIATPLTITSIKEPLIAKTLIPSTIAQTTIGITKKFLEVPSLVKYQGIPYPSRYKQQVDVMSIGKLTYPEPKAIFKTTQIPETLRKPWETPTAITTPATTNIQAQSQAQSQLQKQLLKQMQIEVPKLLEMPKSKKRKGREYDPFGLYGRYQRTWPVATPKQLMKLLKGK